MEKTVILILFYIVTSIGPVPITLGFASENRELGVVTNLNLNRFQGTWHEIGHNPWFPGKDCYAMVAHYKLIADGKIHATNVCRKNSSDGEISKITGTT